MAERERPVTDQLLDILRKREQAQRVGNCGAVLTHRLRHLLVRQTKVADELSIALSLFDRVEILTLEILYQRQTQQLFIADVAYHGRNGGPSEPSGGPEAPFPSYELELAVRSRSN